MKIAVIGAGIIGIASAYELARDGHEVLVFDSNGSAAESSSFANSGVIAPSLMLPMSHPGWPMHSWRRWIGKNCGLRVASNPSLSELIFLNRWNRKNDEKSFLERLEKSHQLIALGQSLLSQLQLEVPLEYERNKGLLALFRSERAFERLSDKLTTLKSWGVGGKLLSPEEVRQVEPALNSTETFAKAMYFPNDEVANCRQLALILKNRAQTMGVKFNFNSTVNHIQTTNSPELWLKNESSGHKFDRIVMATGPLGHALPHKLKTNLQLLPIGSYSLTARIKEPLDAPTSVILDASDNTLIARIGNRVRVSCGAELGWRHKHHTATTQKLYQSLQRWFPGAVHYSGGTQLWKNAYSLSTDGLPILGQSSTPGIWLNLGHGPNGLGMAMGSARIIADQISGRNPALQVEHFTPARFTGN